MAEAEMIELFSLEGIQSKAAVFDTAKLEWMNGQYLSMTPAAELLEPVQRQLARLGVTAGDRDLLALIDAVKVRSRTTVQLAEQVKSRLPGGEAQLDAKGEQLVKKMGPQFATSLTVAREALEPMGPGRWNADEILEVLRGTAEQHTLKLGDLMQPIRVAITGSTVSEPVNELLAVVGRDESLRRLGDGATRWSRDGSAVEPRFTRLLARRLRSGGASPDAGAKAGP
jgi:glutamyl-tRNA synthetase